MKGKLGLLMGLAALAGSMENLNGPQTWGRKRAYSRSIPLTKKGIKSRLKAKAAKQAKKKQRK